MNEYVDNISDSTWKHVKWVYITLVAGIVYQPLLDWCVQNTILLRLVQISIYFTLFFHYRYLYKEGQLSVFPINVQLIILLLGLISFGIVVRGNWNDIELIKLPGVIFNCIKYLLPFLILYLPNYRYHRYILRLFYKFAWLYPILAFIMTRQRSLVYSENGDLSAYEVANFGAGMAFFATFLLGQMSGIFSKREKLCVVGIWGLFLFFALLNARRTSIFASVSMATIAYYYVNSKKGIVIGMVSLFLIGIIALVIYINLNVLFTMRILDYLGERGLEDTRSGVEELFFWDFSHSSFTDWIFGRGVDGGYLQSYQDSDGNIVDIRTGIETGFLNDILKGGIVYVVLYGLLWILSIFRTINNNKEFSSLFRWILLFYIIYNYCFCTVINNSVNSIVFWYIISYVLAQDKIKCRL